MNSYIKDVCVAKQWDIIMQVIRFGHYEEVVTLVRDGYVVTLDLLELLYRVGAKHLLAQIMPYDVEFNTKGFINSAKMVLLKKALGEKAAIDMWKNAISERERQQADRDNQERMRLEARLDELYEMFGLTDDFFASICSSSALMSLALEKYDRKSVAIGLEKYVGDSFYRNNFSPLELAEYGLFERALKYYLAFCNSRERIEVIRQIAQTDEGLKLLVNKANTISGGREKEYLSIVAKDKAIRERLKTYGNAGYSILFHNLNNNDMTEEEFEVWCKINPHVVVFYKQFKKNIFWVIKNGYLQYLL